MRSFILFVTFLSFVMLKPLQASPTNSSSTQLFTVIESFDPTLSEAGKAVQNPNLDQKIQLGMRHLLVRLTGDSTILSRSEAQPFIKQPKSWLSTYRFESRKEDGVGIGQNVVLSFDSRRLLRAFQNAQIQVWPSSERPTTMLMGSYLSSGSLMNLNSENLSYRPDIDIKSYPRVLALPYKIADKSESWVLPSSKESEVVSEGVKAMLSAQQQNYLLSFQIEQNQGQKVNLLWDLFNNEGRVISRDQIEGDRVEGLIQTMFNRTIATYSYNYRQNAEVLNTTTVSFSSLMSAEQVIGIETFLKSKKPLVHQVFLQKLADDKVSFSVVYQGGYKDFLKLVTTVENSVLIDESALDGKINLRLLGLGIIPQTQLIDLTKEFEANAHQEL